MSMTREQKLAMIDEFYRYPPQYGKLNRTRDQNESSDCAVIAVALLAKVSYEDAHAACELAGRRRNEGMSTYAIKNAFEILDVELEEVPGTMRVKKVYSKYYHQSFYRDQHVIMQPNGCAYTIKTIGKGYSDASYLGVTRGHFFSLIDGVVEDWSSNSKRAVISLFKVVGSESPF